MFCCIWWPAGFMVARLVVNNMFGLWWNTVGCSRPRRGRMCITAGGVPKARNLRMVGWGGSVLEEGERRSRWAAGVRPLRGRFSLVSLSAGFVRFALFTRGYGPSPPSATFALGCCFIPLRNIAHQCLCRMLCIYRVAHRHSFCVRGVAFDVVCSLPR